MDMKELQELTGYTNSELGQCLGMHFNRVASLAKGRSKHTQEDYDKINKWLENRGKNLIQIDFKPKEGRPPYSWERKGVVYLANYKRRGGRNNVYGQASKSKRGKDERVVNSRRKRRDISKFFREANENKAYR